MCRGAKLSSAQPQLFNFRHFATRQLRLKTRQRNHSHYCNRMAGLDCPMHTKAFNLFWHKAELRLVEQPEPEAPVFAISRPTLFGGREQFLLQYPARLELPTERDIARHRFTVRHGKKRRSFQAPDATTFDTWLSALEQVLEPKRESENFSTPSTTTSTATTATSTVGTNSQGRASTTGSIGTRGSSRSTLTSNSNSQRSHASLPRAPALRLTLERPCFTRDPNNLKLIRLHRPVATIKSCVKTEADEDILDLSDTDTEVEEEPEETLTDKEDFQDEDVVWSGDTETDGDLSCSASTEAASLAALIVADSIDSPIDDAEEQEAFAFGDESDVLGVVTTRDQNDENIDAEVMTVIEALVVAVDTAQDDGDNVTSVEDIETIVGNDESENIVAATAPTTKDDAGKIKPELEVVVQKLMAAVVKAEDDTHVDSSSLLHVIASPPRSSTKKLAPKSSTRSCTKHKWVPLDPNNSRLIWVHSSVEADVKSAPRSNPKRKGIKPARRWIPVDPSSTRLIWIRRVENVAARIESRYKATSNTRKWVPLDSDNSSFIWVRRQVGTPTVDSSSSRLYRHGKQRRH